MFNSSFFSLFGWKIDFIKKKKEITYMNLYIDAPNPYSSFNVHSAKLERLILNYI